MPRYTSETRERALGLVRSGLTASAAATVVGANPTTVSRWCARAGIALGPGRAGAAGRPRGEAAALAIVAAGRKPRRSPRSRLTLEDRAAIQEGVRAGRSLRSIASELGFSHTTVSREVRRASEGGRYGFREAQDLADQRARRPRPTRLESDSVLRAWVVAGLARHWSPGQVCGRMRLEFPEDKGMKLSHETVYRALYVQGRGTLREELGREWSLRSGRSQRRARSKLPARPGRGWAEGCEISPGPPEAADRAVPGHWEGDLVLGADGRSCLVTLVERRTRYLEARRLLAHDSRTVTDLLASMAAGVPEGLRRSLLRTLTWDQGIEMSAHARFTAATGLRVYFCDPHAPWQKGTNENTNGLLREFFPKGTEFADVTDDRVAEVQDLLNSRPRETLGWRTPSEAMAEVLRKARERDEGKPVQ